MSKPKKPKGLFDPIKRTRDMREEEFTKYVEIRDQQVAAGNNPTDPKIVQEITDQFYDAHRNVPKQKLDEIMDFIHPKIQQNAGLAAFTLDYGGAESGFFFPWLVSVFTSPSAALEMAYGAGYDLAGNWVNSVPESDLIYDFVRNDPTFVYNRERQLYVANLVTSLRDKVNDRLEHGAQVPFKMVDLGAGRLAWARWHGFKFKPGAQAILAFDTDTTINPDTLFKSNAHTLGVYYETADMMHALANPNCQHSDLIMLGGVASYYPTDVFEQMVATPVYELLNPDGVFFFDLQLLCPYLIRSIRIFDWPPLRLKGTAADAINVTERIRQNLWQQGKKFRAEYALDTYNAKAESVMVKFTKLDK